MLSQAGWFQLLTITAVRTCTLYTTRHAAVVLREATGSHGGADSLGAFHTRSSLLMDGPDGCRTHQHSSSGLKSRLTTSTREDAWFAEGPPRAWNGPSCSGGVLGGSYIKNWVRGPIAKCNLSARRRRETGPPQAKKSWVRAPYREKFLGVMGSSPISGRGRNETLSFCVHSTLLGNSGTDRLLLFPLVCLPAALDVRAPFLTRRFWSVGSPSDVVPFAS